MTRKSQSSIHRVPSAGGVEHGYPEGHLGHLTTSEEQALQDFKAVIEEKGLYKPGPPPSHDDLTLLCVAPPPRRSLSTTLLLQPRPKPDADDALSDTAASSGRAGG
jgi:hypothetical protein